MSIVGNSIAQFKRLLFTFLGIIRRAFSCRRIFGRKSSTNESILPVTIKPSDQPHTQFSAPQAYSSGSGQFSQYSQVNSQWQSWDKQNNSYGNPQLEPAAPDVQPLNVHSSSKRQPTQHNDQQQQQEEEDYFKDMMPKVKKQKKILLKNAPMPTQDEAYSPSDKFNLDVPSNFGMMSGNNGVQVGGSWESEDVEIEDSLREAREAERVRRLAEHQRSKEQRKKSMSNKPRLS